MKTLFRYELKSGFKNFLIWTLSVGLMGLVCLLLYKSMESSMEGMAENFATMGAFSDAFGMNILSVATVKGFFATEVGTVHGLGSAMFAACIATTILSKEEEQHTAEFTYTLPISRGKVVFVKYLSLVVFLVFFTIVCALLYVLGFEILDAKDYMQEFIVYMGMQLLMNIEIASICFMISAFNKKNKLGFGIGIAMVLYMYDLMARAIPDLGDYKFLSPFGYANAAEIFSKTAENENALIVGCVVVMLTIIASGFYYTKRDLAS